MAKGQNRLIDSALGNREYLMIIRDTFLLILHKNICCDPSSEPSRQDGSDEGSQHMVSIRSKKNYPTIVQNVFCELSSELVQLRGHNIRFQ